MKVLLLNPPYFKRYSRQSRSPCVTKGGTFYMLYFLSYCCGVLDREGFEVKLIDAVANEWNRKETVNFAKNYRPDLVVVDTSTPSIYNDVEVAEAIKEALPNAFIVLVGTHPTNLPRETLKLSKGIDAIAVGEYDYTIRDLAKTLKKGKGLKAVDGLVFRKGEKIITNKPREMIKNLDELPFVSEVYKKQFGMNGIKKYFYASLRHPQVTILTARGCPYSCSFCNIPFKSSYRARTPENVVDEFEYIQNELPEVKEVMVEDDTFPADKKRTIKICKLLKKRGIKLKWSCNARVNTDFETLKKMKESGCRLLCVGFESPDKKILDRVHKRTTKQMQVEFMSNCRKLGLLVNGCFILGLPDDTKKTLRNNVEFAKQLNPDTAQFYPIMVYPGTEAYKWAKSSGYLTTEDYSKWLTPEGLHSTTVSTPEFSAEELLELCDKARREFYLRPSYIFKKMKQIITKPGETKRNLMAFRVFVKYLSKGYR
jgi:radical SAM superfamily enzyme YgiQ (UPF0313 family)